MNRTFRMLAVAVAGTSLLAATPVLASAQTPIAAVPVAAQVSAAVQAVKITDKVIEEKTDLIEAHLTLPVINGMLDTDYQDKLNAAIEKKARDLLASLKAQSAENAESAKEYDYTAYPYEMQLSYELKSDGSTASGGVLSFTVSTYTYSGGAHGGTFVAGYTIANKPTASALTIAQAVGEGGATAANRAVRYTIQHDSEGMFFPDAMKTFTGVTSDTSFYVEKGTVHLVFQQYDLAPYAAGIIEIPVNKTMVVGPSVRLSRTELASGGKSGSFVPLRKVAEALGYKVSWVQKTRTATLSRDGVKTQITVGSNAYSLNGAKPIQLFAAPKLIGGTLSVPGALFSRILGLTAKTGTDGSLTITG